MQTHNQFQLEIGNVVLKPLVQEPPASSCEICVIVPVRDEAQQIVNALHALMCQQDLHGQPLDHSRYEIIVLVNNCRDDSANIIHSFAKRHPTLALHIVEITLPPKEAHVGWARRLLMDEAYRRLMILQQPRGVIASTDADTRVGTTWVAAILHEIACGADAVSGRIFLDLVESTKLHPSTQLYSLRDDHYRMLLTELEGYFDPKPYDLWPRHYQHYGASLAVTADLYGRVGGIPVLHSLGDHELYKAILRIDGRFRHSPYVRVITSARLASRVQKGLAYQLKMWEESQEHQTWYVESTEALQSQFHGRGQLRKLWYEMKEGKHLTDKEIMQVAKLVGVEADWLTNALDNSLKLNEPFGTFDERLNIHRHVEHEWGRRWPVVPIEDAIHDLCILLQQLRCRC